MKTVIGGLMLTTALGLAGCAKSFHAEVQDVREQERKELENVREKERELQDAKVDAAKNIEKERRDVEDAAAREAANRDANRVEPAPVVVP